ncbi:septal ring lytic transglycosylase RlpA family protein [Segetibacter sp. 3557_3]|uniref:septal ring lytic transglycosylase RlpA family protein n=1 Tax=Segetibacter sp. 3557_3 TaxID=2547429 RepID=UPI0014055352|nr:septal ring lytic transglycosylase RlpA family protein [Segetibacter sp. 3557_3]
MAKTYLILLFLLPLRVLSQGKLKTAAVHAEGTASFYNDNFEGSPTASGESFQTRLLTAASNSFKLHTWVRVTNLQNNISVIVRIIDRMHPRMAKRGRIVDLSKKAARKIRMISDGLAKVKVEVVPAGTEH